MPFLPPTVSLSLRYDTEIEYVVPGLLLAFERNKVQLRNYPDIRILSPYCWLPLGPALDAHMLCPVGNDARQLWEATMCPCLQDPVHRFWCQMGSFPES